MYEDHFLDANIMVISKINWDSRYDNVGKYMSKANIRRHSSKRVFDESNKVFERIRRTILQYINKLDKTFGKFNKLSYIGQNNDLKIKNFNEKFLACLDEKERKILIPFLSQYASEINNLVVFGAIKDVVDFKRKIREVLNSLIFSLAHDCRPDEDALIFRHDNCPWAYNLYYINEYSDLFDIIGYDEDVLVLLDSYFIKENNIKKDMFFVTLDYEHILGLNNKDIIESILKGVFCISPYQ